MILLKNTQRSYAINTTALQHKLARILQEIGYPTYEVTIWFTTNNTIRKYNKQFRGKDAATDVLSFPYYETKKPGILPKKSLEEPILGDIMLSPAYIMQKLAIEPGSETFEERIILLIVHSICHLIGYDHETDADYALMQREEKRLLKLL